MYLRATFFSNQFKKAYKQFMLGTSCSLVGSKSNPSSEKLMFAISMLYKQSDNILIFKHILETISIDKYDQLTMILPALTRGSKGTWKSEGKLHSSNNSCSF